MAISAVGAGGSWVMRAKRGDYPFFPRGDSSLEPEKRLIGASPVAGIRRKDLREHRNQFGHLLVHAAIDLLVGPVDVHDAPMLYEVLHNKGG